MEKSSNDLESSKQILEQLRQTIENMRAKLQITEEEYQKYKKKINELSKNPKLAEVLQGEEMLNQMLEKSKESIKSITVEQLEEIRSYKKPPNRIKMAIEGIYLLLTGKVLEWSVIKKKMVSDDFIGQVSHFNIKKIKPDILAKFKKEYVETKDWDLAKLKKASRAMGPLGEWLESLDFFINQQEKIKKQKGGKEMKQLVQFQEKIENLSEEKQKLQEEIEQKQKELEEQERLVKEQERRERLKINDIDCYFKKEPTKEIRSMHTVKQILFQEKKKISDHFKLDDKNILQQSKNVVKNTEIQCDLMNQEIENLKNELSQKPEVKSIEVDCKLLDDEFNEFKKGIQDKKDNMKSFEQQCDLLDSDLDKIIKEYQQKLVEAQQKLNDSEKKHEDYLKQQEQEKIERQQRIQIESKGQNFQKKKQRGINMKLECKILDEEFEKEIELIKQQQKQKSQNVDTQSIQCDLILSEVKDIMKSIKPPYDHINIANQNDYVQFKMCQLFEDKIKEIIDYYNPIIKTKEEGIQCQLQENILKKFLIGLKFPMDEIQYDDNDSDVIYLLKKKLNDMHDYYQDLIKKAKNELSNSQFNVELFNNFLKQNLEEDFVPLKLPKHLDQRRVAPMLGMKVVEIVNHVKNKINAEQVKQIHDCLDKLKHPLQPVEIHGKIDNFEKLIISKHNSLIYNYKHHQIPKGNQCNLYFREVKKKLQNISSPLHQIEYLKEQDDLSLLINTKLLQIRNGFEEFRNQFEEEQTKNKPEQRWVNIQCNLIDNQIAQVMEIFTPPLNKHIDFTTNSKIEKFIFQKQQALLQFYENQPKQQFYESQPQQFNDFQSFHNLETKSHRQFLNMGKKKVSSRVFQRVQKIQNSQCPDPIDSIYSHTDSQQNYQIGLQPVKSERRFVPNKESYIFERVQNNNQDTQQMNMEYSKKVFNMQTDKFISNSNQNNIVVRDIDSQDDD